MRGLFRVTVFILILCLLLAFGYAAAESTHECHGEDCPICKVIAVLSLLFVTASVPLFLFVACGCYVRGEDAEQRAVRGASLVSLKVKLSD